MSRKPIIVGNWKMNKTIAEALDFVAAVDSHVTDKATFGIGTSFIALNDTIKAAKNLIVAAENCHFEDNGAFTGEVSIPMLKEIGTKYVIIGHSERRQMFGETDEAVNKKAVKLLANGITPIICCGETLEQYEANDTEKVVRGQVHAALNGMSASDMNCVVVAYEPIWAIGTGKSANAEIANRVCGIVRSEVENMFGKDAAEAVRVQYGGSVKPENIKEYMACEHIDGALIGGASLKPESFIAIIEAID